MDDNKNDLNPTNDQSDEEYTSTDEGVAGEKGGQSDLTDTDDYSQDLDEGLTNDETTEKEEENIE